MYSDSTSIYGGKLQIKLLMNENEFLTIDHALVEVKQFLENNSFQNLENSIDEAIQILRSKYRAQLNTRNAAVFTCPKCAVQQTNLIATVTANENEDFEVTELLLNGQYKIPVMHKMKSIDINEHVLYMCQNWHYFAMKVQNRDGQILTGGNSFSEASPIMKELCQYLSHMDANEAVFKTKSLNYQTIAYIERFFSNDST